MTVVGIPIFNLIYAAVLYCDKLSYISSLAALLVAEAALCPIYGHMINEQDGVGPVDNRPSTNYICHFNQKRIEKNVTHDM